MEIIIAAAAVTIICISLVAVAVLKRLGKYDVVQKIQGYQGIAFKIFERVEKAVPDDFGIHTDDPMLNKAAHKMDLFLKEFGKFYKATSGDKVTEVLKDEVKVWVQHWAQNKNDEPEATTDA